MTKKIFKSNAEALTQKLLEQGTTLTEAANKTGIGVDTLRVLISGDKSISLKTASLLQKAFGDSVISCERLKGGETR